MGKRRSVVVVSAQSHDGAGAIATADALSFVERRSRPRHGHIKLIEDAVYRVMREQAQARRAACAGARAPLAEAPPTMVLCSDSSDPAPPTQMFYSQQVQLPRGLGWLVTVDAVARLLLRPAFQPETGKFFRLFRSKHPVLSN